MSSQEPGIHQTTYKQPGGKVPTDATQATMVHTENVEGETVLLDHSSADNIKGERLTMKGSKASNVQASSVQMEKSAAVTVNSEKTVLQDSAAAFVDSGSTRMVKSRAVLVKSDETTLEDGSRAVLIITGGLTGEARALVTVPAATVIGALFAVVAAFLFAIIQGSRK